MFLSKIQIQHERITAFKIEFATENLTQAAVLLAGLKKKNTAAGI